MLQKLHKNAKTNYAIRREIRSSLQPIAFVAGTIHFVHKYIKPVNDFLKAYQIQGWNMEEEQRRKRGRLIKESTGLQQIIAGNGNNRKKPETL